MKNNYITLDADGNLIRIGQQITFFNCEFTPIGAPYIVTNIVGDKVYFHSQSGDFNGVSSALNVIVY